VWLSAKRCEQFRQFYQLLEESGMTPVEMCLRFAISNEFVSTIPIGCKSQFHLEESVSAISRGPLPSDVLRRLDEIAGMLSNRPYEEPMILPFGKSYYGPGIANMGAAVQVGKIP
jgi:aryl-alcohol dehydrogenase-like predicted oxidoreductase